MLHAPCAPTFRYDVDRLPAAQRATAPGVAHGGEVTAVFGTGELCGCLAVG